MEPRPGEETRVNQITRIFRKRLFIIAGTITASTALLVACEVRRDTAPSSGGISSQASKEMEEARKRATQAVPAPTTSPTPTFIPAPLLGTITPDSGNQGRKQHLVGGSNYRQR